MATCAHVGQAVGLAAAICRRDSLLPRALTAPTPLAELQRALLRTGQHIPGFSLAGDTADLAQRATLSASSEYQLTALPADGPAVSLADGWAMMLPVTAGTQIDLTVFADVAAVADLRVELRQSSRADNHTPDVTLEKKTLPLAAGDGQEVAVSFAHTFTDARYAFVCFFGGADIRLRTSEQRLTGVLSLCHMVNLAVAKSAVQTPPADIGVDTFEFWQPQRRPEGRNLALRLARPLAAFGAANVVNGVARPTTAPNAWLAAIADPAPTLTLRWAQPQTIARVELMFDPDYDHPMESVLMGHPERRMPFCVERYRVLDESGAVLATCAENHQARNVIVFASPVTTRALRLELTAPAAHVPAALFEVRCYA
jgi:hypothetical protein